MDVCRWLISGEIDVLHGDWIGELLCSVRCGLDGSVLRGECLGSKYLFNILFFLSNFCIFSSAFMNNAFTLGCRFCLRFFSELNIAWMVGWMVGWMVDVCVVDGFVLILLWLMMMSTSSSLSPHSKDAFRLIVLGWVYKD